MAQQKRSEYSVSRIFTPIALSILLAACSSQPEGDVAQPSNILNEPTQTSEYYLIQADASQGSIQADWLILSLKAAVNEHNTDLANRINHRLAQSQLNNQQQAEWLLARAELLLNGDKSEEALKQLSFDNGWQLEREQWQRYYELRAKIYQTQQQPIKAAEELVYSTDFLNNDQQQTSSDHIWKLLTSVSADDLNSATITNEELQGWQELALYQATLGGSLSKLQSSVQQWLDDNPTHPAALYTPTKLQELLALEIIQPDKTALILPLSGKFSKHAQSIRDGFVFAMLQDKERTPTAKYIVIDSNKSSSKEINQKLIDENVDFIVGPLTKTEITEQQELQQKSNKPIPMLALNFPNEIIADSEFCYVTLSPEQEAEEAARYLAKTGAKYPLVLAPSSSYGKRMTKAFRDEWKQQQNTPAEHNYFSTKSQLQLAVNSIFDLQQSQRRIAQMDSLMGINLESSERSRRDIDAVYIIAKESELTLIKPFISVAINPEATPPKLYASSLSNSGVRRASQELSGITYSDIPMLIEPDQELTKEMKSIWKKSSFQTKRLHALGMDAYSLINALPNMKISPELTIPGQTGVLSINDECVIQRQLSWAEYETIKK